MTMKKNLSEARRARPRLFRRTRIVIVGCGDVGLRLLAQLGAKRQLAVRAMGTTRRAEQARAIARTGGLALQGDLNQSRFLQRLAKLAQHFIVMSPPPSVGEFDPISRRLALYIRQAVHRHDAQARVDYISTTGVYGDANGQWVSETSPRLAQSPRARRRVEAENVWRMANRQAKVSTRIHRAPGIYALERLPIDRLRKQTPAIVRQEDSYSNHIHADDLARWVWRATLKGPAGRVYNVVDDQPMQMGEYFDQVADAAGLERPPRLQRAQVQHQVSPMLWSFMNESRRIRNNRLQELRFKLRYTSTQAFLNQPNISSILRSISD